VDLAPMDKAADPVGDAKAIVEELRRYDPALFEKPRWVVLNKADLIPEPERERRVKAFVDGYFHKRGRAFEPGVGADQPRFFVISALTREGCHELSYAVMSFLEDCADAGAATAGSAAAPE
jgi:GTPase